MAQVTFNVPDTFLTRLVNAYCTKFDYANRAIQGETKAAFAKRMQIEQWYETIKNVEVAASAKNLAITTDADLRTNIIT